MCRRLESESAVDRIVEPIVFGYTPDLDQPPSWLKIKRQMSLGRANFVTSPKSARTRAAWSGGFFLDL